MGQGERSNVGEALRQSGDNMFKKPPARLLLKYLPYAMGCPMSNTAQVI